MIKLNTYQSDQIWQNFATLATFWKSLAILKELLSILPNCEHMLSNVLCYWANFQC